MNSFLSYFNKEFIEGIRNRKFLILAIGILFFGLLDPIAMKLTPIIVESQTDMNIADMLELSQRASIQKHILNLFQIYPIILVFTLMGIVSSEIKQKTLVIPVSLGAKFKGIVSSKLLIYGLYFLIICMVDIFSTYYYSGVIFGFDFQNPYIFIKAGILIALFYTFVVSLLIFWGSIFRKDSLGAMFTIAIVFLMPLIAMPFKSTLVYMPYNLIVEAKYLTEIASKELFISLVWTLFYIFILNGISVMRLERSNLM